MITGYLESVLVQMTENGFVVVCSTLRKRETWVGTSIEQGQYGWACLSKEALFARLEEIFEMESYAAHRQQEEDSAK